MSYRLINDLDVNVFNFKKFGKELPKQHKMSPHSFIQVALQLAYYRSVMTSLPSTRGCCWQKWKYLKFWSLVEMTDLCLGCWESAIFFLSLKSSFFHSRVHNEVCATCDMVSQRMFRGGRTEFVRSPMNQMLGFILAFDDPTVSVRDCSWRWIIFRSLFVVVFEKEQNWACFIIIPQREAKVQLFRDAVDEYSELITQVNNGQTPKGFFLVLKAYQPMFLLSRHLKDMESIATCWALSYRPSRKDALFLKFSWTQPTVWRHTGSSEQGRCVCFCFCSFGSFCTYDLL